jgi:hypothetical protein
MFCKSGMFGDVRDVAKAFVKIQAGREIGVPPFAAMRGVQIIQGNATLGATLVAGRMKAHGYDWTEIRRDKEVCELEIFKPNGKRAGTAKYTFEDAKDAGLTGKDNWKKYPKSMLFARCITDAARTFAPEVFSGIPIYTAEELGATNTNEDGEENIPLEGSHLARQQVLDRELEKARAAGIDVDKYKAPQQIQQQAAAPALPEFYMEKRKRMTGKFEALGVFAELKDECLQVLGDHEGIAFYRAVLAAHGVEKSDQFKTLGSSQKCAMDLMARLVNAKAVRAEDEAGVVDAEPVDDNFGAGDGKLFDTEPNRTYQE